MSTVKFNIGLVSSKTGQTIEAGTALKQLFAYLDEPITSLRTLKIAQSDTEPTLVVSLELTEREVHIPFSFSSKVYSLAGSLEQDCIAVKNVANGNGNLLGPRADKWLPFDNSKFID